MSGLFLTNCSKEDFNNNPITLKSGQTSYEPSNLVLNDCSSKERFAKVLSKAIVDRNILDFIIDKASKHENGDEMFLYSLASDKELINGSSFSNELSLFDQGKDGFFTRNVIETNPLLSIYLFLPNDFKISEVKNISKVYFHCSDDEEYEVSNISYYEDGKMFSSSKKEKPLEPVIVILQNDRIIAHKGVNNRIIDDISHKYIGRKGEFNYTLSGIFPTNVDNRENRISNGLRTYQRDIYKQREGVYRFLYSDDLEGWFMGDAEIKIDMLILQSGTSNIISNVYNMDDSEDMNHWVSLPHDPIIWYKNIYGDDYMRYHITEQDGSSNDGKYEFGIEIDGYGLNFSFGANPDDLYGMSDVYYNEWVSPNSWGTHHNAGSDARFYVNVK